MAQSNRPDRLAIIIPLYLLFNKWEHWKGLGLLEEAVASLGLVESNKYTKCSSNTLSHTHLLHNHEVMFRGPDGGVGGLGCSYTPCPSFHLHFLVTVIRENILLPAIIMSPHTLQHFCGKKTSLNNWHQLLVCLFPCSISCSSLIFHWYIFYDLKSVHDNGIKQQIDYTHAHWEHM